MRRLLDPQGTFTYAVLRPLSDLFLWLWRLERRIEFLYRPQFDRRLRGPLFEAVQRVQNSLRTDEHLALAEEKELPDEDRYTPRSSTRSRSSPGRTGCPAAPSGSATPRRSACCGPSSPCSTGSRPACGTGLFADAGRLPGVRPILRTGAVRATRPRGLRPVLGRPSR